MIDIVATTSTNRSTVLKSLALTFLLSSAPVQGEQANAADMMAFFEALKTEVESRGGQVEYGTLTDLGGGDVEALDIRIEDPENDSDLSIRKLFVAGGETDGENRFSFDALEASGITLEQETNGNDSRIQIGSFNAEDFAVRRREGERLPFWPFDMASGEATGVHLVQTGRENISWNLPEISIGKLETGSGSDYSLARLLIGASTGSVATRDGGDGSFALGEIRLSGMEVSGLGYRVDRSELGRFSLEGSDGKARAFSLNFDGIEITNLVAPDFANGEAPWFPSEDTVTDVGQASLTIDGKDLMIFGGGRAVTTYGPDGVSQQTSFGMRNFYLDLAGLAAIDAQEKSIKPLTDLGYKDVTLQIAGEVGWNAETGVLNVSQLRYGADNMASLDIAMTLSGLDAAVAGNLQKISDRLNSDTDRTVQQALAFQMMAELSGLSIREMTLTLDDASLTKRIMESQARQSGQEAEDLVAALPFMAGAMMAPLEAPDFTAQVAGALGNYFKSALGENARLIIGVRPDEPVSFAELTGIIAGVRAGNVKASEIIERLNLTVRGE